MWLQEYYKYKMDNQQYMMDDIGYEDQEFYYESYDYEPNKSLNPFEILPQSSIFSQISVLVQQTSQTVALSYGWSLLLLRQFKWQTHYLGDYFQDKKKYQQLIAYDSNLLSTEAAKKLRKFDICNVCLEKNQLIYNICKEGFCRNCWSGHIQQHLNNLNPFMKCMSCNVPILHETVKDILSASEYSKVYNRYQKQICQCFTNTNRAYKCCPGADCSYCIKCQNYGVTTVKCICGKSFCFKCQGDDHSPCTCQQKIKWCDIVLKEEANAKWIAQNTKLCPWCNKAVQRSQGCNFMACLCGKSFCYMCSKPWQPDHKDHFKCHIYRKKPEDQQNREKAVLQKLNFFAQKYLNTNAVVTSLKTFDTFEKRKMLYQSLNVDLTESDFIDQAYKFAIECCESLKWIYVYTYFVQILDQNRRQSFQFSQGQYESFKQQLLKKLSYDLKNFLVELEKSLETNHRELTQQSKKKFLQVFWGIKTSIINYYKFTQQFKQKFLHEIQSLQDEAIKRVFQKSQQKQQKKSETKKIDNKKTNKKKQ